MENTRFFTNRNGDTLLSRFQKTLKGTKEFDVLVGYFFSSGFDNIYKSLDNVEKIRILVGLNVDKDIFNRTKNKDLFNKTPSQNKIKENFSNELVEEFEVAEDTIEVQESVNKFKEYLLNGKLEIRVCPNKIHSKVYICQYSNNQVNKGCVITGSSNFSENGLKEQGEFNVELRDDADVNFALEEFEKLWKEGIDIKEEYITTINTKTHYRSDITPYELYLKLLYEYFKEELELDDKIKINISSNNYKRLKYQEDAVKSAIRILNTYNGVILSDVVGLGKTNITCALLSQYPNEKKLILCPPPLMDNWNNTLNKYGVTNCNGNVRSMGEIDKINPEDFENGIIVIDEAHRFRNSETTTYATLSKICLNKRVVLVSATPYNNKFDDIFSLIKLFQPAKNSDIEGCSNLEFFFNNQIKKELLKYKVGTKEYFNKLKQASKMIREKVLRYIMIRRTRKDLMNEKNGWTEDLKVQGVEFPVVAKPRGIIYEFNKDIEYRFKKL